MTSRAWFLSATFGALLLVQSGLDATEGETSIALSRALRAGHISVAERPFGPWFSGPDGQWYLAHEAVAPALAVPLVALGDLGPLPPSIPRDRWVRFLQASMGAVLGTLIAWLLSIVARGLWGLDERRARMTAWLSLFGSMLLPYARTNYDGQLSGALLLAGLVCGLDGSRGRVVATGMLLGLAFVTRPSSALVVAPLALAVAWDGRGRDSVPRMAWLVAGALPFVATLAWLNGVRTGSWHVPPVALPAFAGNNALATPFFTGFLGNLVSPGKGLPWHAPLAIVGLAALLSRRTRTLGLAVLAGLLLLAAAHARVRNWSGHWGWGPRYVLPVVPLMLAGLGGFWQARRRWLAVVAVPSFVASLLPVLVFWNARIAAGAGDPSHAFEASHSPLRDAAVSLVEVARGRCPNISSFEAPGEAVRCVPDLWWIGWPVGYGATWAAWVAGLIAIATAYAVVKSLLREPGA